MAELFNTKWLRAIRPHPLAVAGHVEQPRRKYVELSRSDVERLIQIADSLETAHDAICRAHRVLWDCVQLNLSPAAWDSLSDGPPELQESGPEWRGLPGEHPLLPLLKNALIALRAAP